MKWAYTWVIQTVWLQKQTSNDKGIQAVVNKHCFHFNEGENWLPSFPGVLEHCNLLFSTPDFDAF